MPTNNEFDQLRDMLNQSIEGDLWVALESELTSARKKLQEFMGNTWNPRDIGGFVTEPRDPETVGKKPLATAIRQTIGNTNINAIGEELPSIDWNTIIEMEKKWAKSLYDRPLGGNKELFNDMYMCRYVLEPEPPKKIRTFDSYYGSVLKDPHPWIKINGV